MDIAVITGASSGLGKVFCEKVAERYPSLDEIWVIARRADKLKELADKHKDRKIRIIPLDLSAPQSFDALDAVLNEQRPNIKVLINNAGFDRPGLFRTMKTSDIYSLINVNVTGMTMINRCCLPYMSKGSYEIITGSIGSFVPLPWRAVYGASKTYGRFFARALREEERRRGVNIMLLSPGGMDTEMFRENTAGGKLAASPFLNLDKVTVRAMKKAEKGAGAYTPRLVYKAVRVFGKLVPSAIAVKFTSVESSVPQGY